MVRVLRQMTHRPGLQRSHTIVLLLSLVTLVVFCLVYGHAFVLWDDNVNVYENPFLNPVSLEHVLAFWRAPYAHLYIPFTYTLWALTAAISWRLPPDAAGQALLAPQLFHSLNVLVHLLSVLVVWRLIHRLLVLTVRPGSISTLSQARLEWAACGGALLFAVHPLQVEAVTWVTGFKDVWCGLLSYLALWQYLASGGTPAPGSSSRKLGRKSTTPWTGRYGLATGIFVLALLAKPSAVVLPIIAWLLDAWCWPQTWRSRIPALAGWGLIAVAWGFMTSQVQPAATVLVPTPLWSRPLIAGDAVTFYLSKLFLPFTLGPDYGRAPEVVLAQPWLWLTGLLPWGLAAGVWQQRARISWLGAAAGVMVASLSPVLGWVPFGFQYYSTVADRYMYVAMLGPALALAWCLTQWSGRWVIVGTMVVVGLLGLRSLWQTRYWQTTVALFEHALTVNPQSALAHQNLGIALESQGAVAEVLHHYTEALRLRPSYAQAHYNLGRFLVKQGNTTQAIQHYEAALRFQPAYAEAHNNLGMVLASQGRSAEAMSHYQAALRLQTENAEAYNNLGNALASQGNAAQAVQYYRTALRLQPTFAEAHNNLGSALLAQGRIDEAMQHYTEALRLQPTYARVHYNLGNILAQRGNVPKAVQHYHEALRLQPTFAEAHNNLGSALATQGRLDEAIHHYTEALRLQPDYVKAHYSLGVAFAKQGRLAEARQQFSEVLRLDPQHATARRLLDSLQP